MKKLISAIFVTLLLVVLAASIVSAQSTQLSLTLKRDWGYGGFSNDIQGLFTMQITGPADLAKVTFYIDKTAIGTDDQSPFSIQFTTDDYPLGVHQLSAVGVSTSGAEYASNMITAEFVTARRAGQTILPIVGVILGVVVLSAVVPLLFTRRRRIKLPMGAERTYGIAGGAICSRCHRPFPLSMFSLNVGLGSKLAACPYCGKINFTRRQPLEVLRTAEKAELEGSQPQIQLESEEEKLRKEIDESKYQGF